MGWESFSKTGGSHVLNRGQPLRSTGRTPTQARPNRLSARSVPRTVVGVPAVPRNRDVGAYSVMSLESGPFSWPNDPRKRPKLA